MYKSRWTERDISDWRVDLAIPQIAEALNIMRHIQILIHSTMQIQKGDTLEHYRSLKTFLNSLQKRKKWSEFVVKTNFLEHSSNRSILLGMCNSRWFYLATHQTAEARNVMRHIQILIQSMMCIQKDEVSKT